MNIQPHRFAAALRKSMVPVDGALTLFACEADLLSLCHDGAEIPKALVVPSEDGEPLRFRAPSLSTCSHTWDVVSISWEPANAAASAEAPDGFLLIF